MATFKSEFQTLAKELFTEFADFTATITVTTRHGQIYNTNTSLDYNDIVSAIIGASDNESDDTSDTNIIFKVLVKDLVNTSPMPTTTLNTIITYDGNTYIPKQVVTDSAFAITSFICGRV
jgi:hypothetical protein